MFPTFREIPLKTFGVAHGRLFMLGKLQSVNEAAGIFYTTRTRKFPPYAKNPQKLNRTLIIPEFYPRYTVFLDFAKFRPLGLTLLHTKKWPILLVTINFLLDRRLFFARLYLK